MNSAALLLLLLALPLAAAEGEVQLKISTDRAAYGPGDRMVVTGNLTRDGKPILTNITFQIDDPKGNTILILTKPTNDNGTATITLKLAYDAASGKYDVSGSAKVNDSSVFVTQPVQVKKKTPVPGTDNRWLLAGVSLLAVAGGGGAAAVYLRRRREEPDEETADEAAAGVAEAEAAPEPYIPGPLIIEEVFLVNKSGLLIAHETRRMTPGKDAEMVSGMFTAIQDFVKESFDEEGELGSLEYGENEVLIERGKHLLLAVVVKGTPPPEYRATMREVIASIEAKYAGKVEKWDGEKDTFKGVGKDMKPLFVLPEAPAKAEAKKKEEVKVLAATEFYQGYIRVKVAVKNDSSSVITGVAFEPIFEETSFKLVRIEPDLPEKKGKVDFGVVNPGVKKTVALYLEPLICTESFVEGTATYKDAGGTLHSIVMPRKRVEVVCPIFFTEENANTAMLKRLMGEELKQQDRRLFRVPASIEFEKAYTIGIQVVQRHQVRMVREFTEKSPYAVEGWFYGTTKDQGYKMIIKVGVRESTGTLEIFVASPGKLLLTGLLAELGRELAERFEREGARMSAISDIGEKDEVAERAPSLLDKYSESEIEAGETETKDEG